MTWSSLDNESKQPFPALRLDGISRVVPGDPPIAVLQEIDLIVERGEYVCIVGPSGSGKSSLLNQLGLLDRPSQGRFLLDGIDTGSLTERDRTRLRAERIGFVFQEFHLLNQRTVLANVALGMVYTEQDPELRDAKAREAITRVGLEHRMDALPATLSGGERQRTAIARAVAGQPNILLCDEPTGNLDSGNSANILALLAELCTDGVTLVVVTHDQSVADAAQRQIVLRDGALVADRRISTPVPVDQAKSDEIPDLDLKRWDKERKRRGVRLSDLGFEAIASLGQRLSRTLVTMAGTALGIGAFVAVLGLNSTAAGQIASDFSLTRATEVTVNDVGGSDVKGSVFSFPLDADTIATSIDGVSEAGVTWQLPIGGSVPVATSLDPRADEARVVISAASPGYLRTLGTVMESGKLFTAFHDDRKLPVAILGAGAARELNISTVRNQPTVFIQGTAFTVVGIIADVEHDPSVLSSILIPAQTALEIYGEPLTETPAQMRVRTAVGAAEVVAAQLPLALRPDQPTLLQAIPPTKPFEVESRVSESLQSLFLLLAAVILLIAAASIANVNLITVLERTPELGLRRAIGAQPRDISRQILFETGFIGLIGGLAGTALAVAAVVSTAAVMSWTAILNPFVTLLGPVLGVLVGVLAGLFPARRASKIEPIAALRR